MYIYIYAPTEHHTRSHNQQYATPRSGVKPAQNAPPQQKSLSLEEKFHGHAPAPLKLRYPVIDKYI